MKVYQWLRKRPVASALLLVGLGMLCWWLLPKKADSQFPGGVSLTAKVEAGDVTEKIEETARLEPLKVVSIKANATGHVRRLAVAEGDFVKAGQLLAVIQPGRPGEQFQPSSVLAPMTGVVIERNVEEGDIVTSGLSEFNGGTQIMAVAKLDAMIATFQVNEVDIGRIKKGMTAVLRLEAFQDISFTGKVLSVAPKAKPAEGSSLNTFGAKVLVEGQNSQLKPGMSAAVEIITATRKGVFTLPVESVFESDGKMVVYKAAQNGKGYQKLEVETGLSDNQRVEIVSGLALGDEISKLRPLKEMPPEK